MWIADLSFAWPNITGTALKRLGADGVIGYAGCNNPKKNVSEARFEDWLESGLMVSLVIENSPQDLKGGYSVGLSQGKALFNAATDLGYDYDNCVLFTAADWNSRGTDLDRIEEALDAFGDYIPHPGIYGNSYAIDRCYQSEVAVRFWQSNSTSFSNGTSQHANLQQLFNDPRAQGLTLDVNDVKHGPLLFMNEETMATVDDVSTTVLKKIAASVLHADGLIKAPYYWNKGRPASEVNEFLALSTHIVTLQNRLYNTAVRSLHMTADINSIKTQMAKINATNAAILDAISQLVSGATVIDYDRITQVVANAFEHLTVDTSQVTVDTSQA